MSRKEEKKAPKLCKCMLDEDRTECKEDWDPFQTHQFNHELDYSSVDMSKICLNYCALDGRCRFGQRCRYEHPPLASEFSSKMLDLVKEELLLVSNPDPISIVLEYFKGLTFHHQMAVLAAPYNLTLKWIQDLDLICPLWLKGKCHKHFGKHFANCGMSHHDEDEWKKWERVMTESKFAKNFRAETYAQSEKYLSLSRKARHYENLAGYHDHGEAKTCREFRKETQFKRVFDQVWKMGAQNVHQRMILLLDEISDKFAQQLQELERQYARTALKRIAKASLSSGDRLDRALDRNRKR